MTSLLKNLAGVQEGYVTAYELHADLTNVPFNELARTSALQGLKYPTVQVTQDHHRQFAKDTVKSHFLVEEQKQLWHAWQDGGVEGVYEELIGRLEQVQHAGFVQKATFVSFGYIARIARFIFSIASSAVTQTQLEVLLVKHTKDFDRARSAIHCLSWHPHCDKFAVGLRDNSVRIYDCQRSDIVPLLKHKQQTHVSDMAWKPFSTSVLAVACSQCIVVWRVEPTSLSARPPSSAAVVLPHVGIGPITSISWDPQGGLLAASSPSDNYIVLWDVISEAPTPLNKVMGGGIPQLCWSPDGCRLVSTSCSQSFQLWQCQRWTSEFWSGLAGRCTAACWSPNGSILLFATAERPAVYCVRFAPDVMMAADSQAASVVADVSEVDVETGNGTISVGGCIHAMAWDQNGARLAVQFTGGALVLFQTTTEPTIEIMPIGLVKGPRDEMASVFSFKPHFDRGSLLTVAWSGGSLSYIPLFYENPHIDRLQRFTGNGHLPAY